MKVKYVCLPCGLMELVEEDGAIVSVKGAAERRFAESDSQILRDAECALRACFAGERADPPVRIRPKGTAFETAVWEQISKIPYGETRTYSEIAAALGRAKAVRAVGRACGKNPIWILIPCHRVIGKNKALTGYAGGMDMKRMLLDTEREHKGR